METKHPVAPGKPNKPSKSSTHDKSLEPWISEATGSIRRADDALGYKVYDLPLIFGIGWKKEEKPIVKAVA